ncbi:hypothetical protein HDE_12901 [Halotydeus destructor]|nr:hypothetical protein HDE_12901 [Halotydeus destructor]
MAKISDRFSLDSVSRPVFRVVSAPFGDDESNIWISSLVRRWFENFKYGWYYFSSCHSNHKFCSVSVIQDTSSQLFQGSGNMSREMQMLANDLADFAFDMARLSGHVGEPVTVGPPSLSADLLIMSSAGNDSKVITEITDIIYSGDGLGLIYLFLLLHFTAIVASFYRSSNAESQVKLYISQMYHSWALLVDQEHLNPGGWIMRSIWLLVCFSAFMYVSTLTNLISTDSIAPKVPDRINYVDDLYRKPFLDVKLYMYRDLYFFDAIRLAPAGSRYGKLHARLEEGNKCPNDVTFWRSCSYFKARHPNDLYRDLFFDRVREAAYQGNGAILLNKQMMLLLGFKTMCQIQTELIARLHFSKEIVGSEILTFYVRKSLDREMKRYALYRLTTYFEFSVHHHDYSSLADIWANMATARKSVEYYMCVDKFKETGDMSVTPIKVSIFSKVCCTCLAAVFLGLLVLLVELGMSRQSFCYSCLAHKASQRHKPDSDRAAGQWFTENIPM